MDFVFTKFFINEVKKRPVIWNKELADYSNKNAKKIAWLELVGLFKKHVNSEEEAEISKY